MRFSAEDRRAHVALWRESGMSRARYCRENAVPYQAFVAWTHAAEEAEAPSGFVQLADDRPGVTAPGRVLRVEFGSLVLAFSDDSDPGWVARVIAGLSPC